MVKQTSTDRISLWEHIGHVSEVTVRDQMQDPYRLLRLNVKKASPDIITEQLTLDPDVPIARLVSLSAGIKHAPCV